MDEHDINEIEQSSKTASSVSEETGDMPEFFEQEGFSKREEHKVVTIYGSVPAGRLSAINIAEEVPDVRNAKSPVKRFIQWFFAILACVVAGAACVGAYMLIASPASDTGYVLVPGGGYTMPSKPDFGEDKPISDSDYLTSKTSNAGLGIIIQQLDTATAESFGIEGGLVILGVEDYSCLSATDVQVYDIITKAEGKPIKTLTELSVMLNEHEVGDDFALGLTRFTNGWPESFDMTVKLIDKNGPGEETEN